MLSGEITAICFESHTKHINARVRETVMLKAVLRAVTTVLQRVKGHYSPDALGCTPSMFANQPHGTAVGCRLIVVECAGLPPAGKQSFVHPDRFISPL
jgi:hypothetical protein